MKTLDLQYFFFVLPFSDLFSSPFSQTWAICTFDLLVLLLFVIYF
ncbi:hypothetical protein KSS87_015715 [Heliosperma pusillum]|nr:hypothetical protein KSS87_012172 [Heliosperma pusillum]KAH9610834.1 hypothetical protein KSS87_017671 [Heliosperma pusillum]KAH9617147.1 hypothetical protein KSS87_013939 [Heliosperma pusillum]KAH9620693.1 hypothetical protein KSS87_015715 [Heliosperma pusillum]